MRSKTFPGIARAIAEQWTIQIALEENLLDEDEIKILGNDYLKLNPKNSQELAQIEEREQALIELFLSKL
jgi:hypothetical protein